MPEQARTTARRRAVMEAVVAITQRLEVMRAGHGVRAFHVRFFGIEECVAAPLSTIERDLRWLEQHGCVKRPRRKRAEFAPTDAGRAWIA